MPTPRVLPDVATLTRMVDAGMTHRQIAEEVSADTGQRITRAAVSAALSRAGKIRHSYRRYDDVIPWTMRDGHGTHYGIRMLRLLGRRRAGGELTEHDARRLDSWLDQLSAEDAVVAYSPELGPLYVPARFGIDGTDGIPIRRGVVHPDDLA